MDWLNDILKHLAVSRALVGAICVTAVVMALGPRFAPTVVPKSPDAWLPVIFGAMVLTGCLLLYWGVHGAFNLGARALRSARATVASANISSEETELLFAMGKNPSESLDLDDIDYDRAPFSRLELMAMISGLEKKGFVHVNEYAENLVSLTTEGRARALEIQRAARK